MQGYVGPLVCSRTDGPTLTGSNVRTLLLYDHMLATLGSLQVDNQGRKFVAKALARLSTAASSPGTLTLDLQLGSAIIAASQALTLATSQTNITLRLEWELFSRDSSNLAAFMHGGEVKCAALSGGPLIMIPATAPAIGNTFSASDAGKLGLYGTFSSNSGSNALTIHGFTVESFN